MQQYKLFEKDLDLLRKLPVEPSEGLDFRALCNLIREQFGKDPPLLDSKIE